MRRGFTLIELTVVLIVIGLVVGAIVMGRDMVRSAEIRGTIAQVEQFNAAVNAFKSKYHCLPGDCVTAAAYGFAAGSSGDGNGVIGCHDDNMFDCADAISFLDTPESAEYVNFWYHLGAAGLIAFDGAPYDGTDPEQSAGTVSPVVMLTSQRQPGGWTVRGGAEFSTRQRLNAHSFVLGGVAPIIPLDNGRFRPVDVYAVDQKMDDGMPFSGSVRAWQEVRVLSLGMQPSSLLYTHVYSGSGVGTARCMVTSSMPYQYNLTNLASYEESLCGALFTAAF